MGKTLIIAEKPSVGRDIARVLGCAQKADGFLFSDKYVVSWAIGHLVTLCDPEDYDAGLKRWHMDALPILPVSIKTKALTKTKPQFTILKRLMNDPGTDRIVCATDSGREGELIFRYIYHLAGCKKPFDRLWISSMTDAAIKEGFANLRPGGDYDALYASAKCRSEADWLVGINASRAFTLRYDALLSVGRVQTPTLSMIVARQKEIDAFVPEEYYEIGALMTARGITFKSKWFNPADNETKIKNIAQAQSIYKAVTDPPSPAVAISSESEEKRQPPPPLYDLTELQRDANKKYGFSAKETLDIAQDLYEKRKLITYPRTDSRYLSHDIAPKFPKILTKLSGCEPYKPFASRLLSLDALPVTKRVVDDTKVTDHHAIIPTDSGALDLSNLTAGESAVFGLVARRFMAVFFPYYVYNALTLFTSVNGERFVAKGVAVVQEGWTEIYKHDKDTDKKDDDENAVIPRMSPGEMAAVDSVALNKKKTKPPPSYTEASLLSAMEHAGRFTDDEALKEQLRESGLGTPATRAATIERLLTVGYILRRGKTLLPTEKGVKLVEAVPEELKTPETTGKWEKGLKSIASGTMEPTRFMASIERYVRYIVNQAKNAAPDIVFPNEKRKRAAKAPPKSTKSPKPPPKTKR